jgi:hypothetical protein
MAADDFLGFVAADRFRPTIPGHDISRAVKHHDRMIGKPIDERSHQLVGVRWNEMQLSFAQDGVYTLI